MKVLDFIMVARTISSLDPQLELDVTLVDHLLKISHDDDPVFHIAIKVD